ncbi:quinolinate synthase NadA [Dictyobacter arantiisoli]|uniref:Quinolinate synthase n=1 Tax=Dictyobacter arantiisoli TaxID=2014874 RepID=A0A5A5T9L0_9CHLR|nr:quinolinate synthase NadA [Dictyobacter arantiisoli]GCF08078.1 quinolinate synthase A [Dictyobacter arantiisoli]
MAVKTECAVSQETHILPLLNPQTRAKRDVSKRIDGIPLFYAEMDGEELDRRITAARAALGERLVILGHHYQRDEIIKYADYRGDSFKLAQLASKRKNADYIVFCGVHFMAESADVLSEPHQKVILPNPAAGCSMADMANIAEVEECWELLHETLGEDAGIIPVTYMNSAANLKAFCGEHGGIVCTSSNAPKVIDWAFTQGKRVLFFPDQHLGRNTASHYGIHADQMVVWDPKDPMAFDDAETVLENSRIILWKGHCSTHMRFSVPQIEKARQDYPGINIIVHPECRQEVVEAADLYGSTEYIIEQIEKAPAGSQWGVATEINLVHRLAQENPDKFIFCLDPIVCPCSTMYRIHPAYVAWILDALLDGQVLNQISVDEETTHWARVALERMLSL